MESQFMAMLESHEAFSGSMNDNVQSLEDKLAFMKRALNGPTTKPNDAGTLCLEIKMKEHQNSGTLGMAME